MNELMNELITGVFVEQPLALPGSANYMGRGHIYNKFILSWIMRVLDKPGPEDQICEKYI